MAQKQPNIILIMADDLGYNDLGCYHNDSLSTPHIDRLAKEGIQLFDYHSNGAVCSPTRAALMTGKYQQRTGITGVVTAKSHRDVGLPSMEKTLAEYLKESGYTTGVIGKWHLGYDTTYSPLNQGFDFFRGFVSGNIDYHSHYDQENHFDWWDGKEWKRETGYATDLITGHSLDFIEKNRDEPFFLYIPHGAPHYPYQGRESESFRGPNWDGVVSPGSPETKKAYYKEMIEVMDEGIGRIVGSLTDLGLIDRTLIFFVSDNGAAAVGSNRPLRGGKAQLWEGGHRVPGIVYGPGFVEAGKNESLILSMDILPTVLDVAGIDSKNLTDIDGRSFLNVLSGNAAPEDRTVFWKHRNSIAVRKGKWKLVREKEEWFMFNLEVDIRESQNIIHNYPDRFEELQQILEAWEKEMSGYKVIS